MITFGKRIRALREAAGKSLRDMADALGVSVVYVSDIERGRRNPPHEDKLDVMADVIGVSRDDVREWAMIERRRVDLDIGDPGSPSSNAALALARRWNDITEDEANAILQILQAREACHDK